MQEHTSCHPEVYAAITDPSTMIRYDLVAVDLQRDTGTHKLPYFLMSIDCHHHFLVDFQQHLPRAPVHPPVQTGLQLYGRASMGS